MPERDEYHNLSPLDIKADISFGIRAQAILYAIQLFVTHPRTDFIVAIDRNTKEIYSETLRDTKGNSKRE